MKNIKYLIILLCILLTGCSSIHEYDRELWADGIEQGHQKLIELGEYYFNENIENPVPFDVSKAIIGLKYFNQKSLKNSKGTVYRYTYISDILCYGNCITIKFNSKKTKGSIDFLEFGSLKAGKTTSASYKLDENDIKVFTQKINITMYKNIPKRQESNSNGGGYELFEYCEDGEYGYFLRFVGNKDMAKIVDAIKSAVKINRVHSYY